MHISVSEVSSSSWLRQGKPDGSAGHGVVCPKLSHKPFTFRIIVTGCKLLCVRLGLMLNFFCVLLMRWGISITATTGEWILVNLGKSFRSFRNLVSSSCSISH
jgi:hypothetical protein